MALLYIAFCLWSAKCVPNRQLSTPDICFNTKEIQFGTRAYPSVQNLTVNSILRTTSNYFFQDSTGPVLIVDWLFMPRYPCPRCPQPLHTTTLATSFAAGFVVGFSTNWAQPAMRSRVRVKRALQTPVKSVRGTHVFRLVSKQINFKPCNGFCWCYLKCAEKRKKKKRKKKRKKCTKMNVNPNLVVSPNITHVMCKTIYLQAENYSHHE